MPLVYLAGPITGLDYDGSVDWRRDVDWALDDRFVCASPMRAKRFLDTGEIIDHTNVVYDNPLSSPQGVMMRDSWDVHRADALFVNFLGAERVSIGTVMEIAWAWRAGTPTVVVMEPDNIHKHVMLQQATPFYCTTLEEGILLMHDLFE